MGKILMICLIKLQKRKRRVSEMSVQQPTTQPARQQSSHKVFD